MIFTIYLKFKYIINDYTRGLYFVSLTWKNGATRYLSPLVYVTISKLRCYYKKIKYKHNDEGFLATQCCFNNAVFI